MKAGWEVKSLGDLCKFVRGPFGGSLKKNIFVQEGYAVYEQQHAIYNQFNQIRYFIDKNKFNEMSRFVLNSGDLIMSCSGTMGKVAIVPENIKAGIINQALLKLTPSKLLLPKFLKYWMDSESFQDGLREQSGGAAIQNVASVAILKEIKIPHPNPGEQQRIVSILDQAFEGIANALANAEQNLQNARALFESHLQSVFTQRGEGWADKRLGDIVTRLTNGYVGPTRDIYLSEGVPYLLARHVKNNQLKFDGKTFISEEFNNKNKKSILKAGDVLLVQSGHIGHSALVTEEHAGHNCHAMIVLTPIPEILDGSYLSLYFNSSSMRDRFDEIRSGSTVPHLTCGAVKELPIPLPSVKSQKIVVGSMMDLAIKTQRLEALYQRKIACLDELKKSLLQQAFAGEL